MQLKIYDEDSERGGPYFVAGPHGWVEVDYTVIDNLLPRNKGKTHPNPWWFNQARKEAFERDKVCRACGSEKNLEAHHVTYDRWGHELASDLTIFCGAHHELIEVNKRIARRAA